MDKGICGRAQVAIHYDAAVGVFDIACGKIQRIDIGNAACAIDDPIGLGCVLGAVMAEDDAQAAVGGLDPFDADGQCVRSRSGGGRPRRCPGPATIAAAPREW